MRQKIQMQLLDKIVVSIGFFGGFILLSLGGIFDIGFFNWMGVVCLATNLIYLVTKYLSL